MLLSQVPWLRRYSLGTEGKSEGRKVAPRTWEPWWACDRPEEVPGKWTNTVITHRVLFLPANGSPFASLP